MREIRQSGSEGGAIQTNALSLPLYCFKGFLYSRLLGSDNMTDFYEAIHCGFRIFLKALRKEK